MPLDHEGGEMRRTHRIWSRVPTLVVALGAFIFVGAAHAADAYVYENSIKVPQRLVTPTDAGQAIFNTDTRFSSVDSICLYVWFNPTNPLDPGEELRFTPNSWFDTNPYAAGPGFINGGESAQTFRALCIVNSPGYPIDPFLAEFLDGRHVFKLTSYAGSMLVDRIDIAISGSTD
jgi:hypothetical protein